MSQKPLTMEQLKQVLQLKNDGVAIREIARRTGISRNAVKRYLLRLEPPCGDPPVELTNKQLSTSKISGKLFASDHLKWKIMYHHSPHRGRSHTQNQNTCKQAITATDRQKRIIRKILLKLFSSWKTLHPLYNKNEVKAHSAPSRAECEVKK